MVSSPAQNLSQVALWVNSGPSSFSVTTNSNIQLSLDSVGNLTMNGADTVFSADFSNADPTLRTWFQTTTANGNTFVGAYPQGNAVVSGFLAASSSNNGNARIASISAYDGTDVRIASERTGTVSYIPMTFWTSGSEKLRIDVNGNVGIGSSSPVFKLDVTGSQRNTGNLTLGGNLNISGAINFSDGSVLQTSSLATAVFDYTGNGVTTTFSTGNYNATSTVATDIYLQGVYQRKNQYSWVGTNIIFTAPPPVGAQIEILINTLTSSINVPAPGTVTPAALSTGGPSWDVNGNLSVTGYTFTNNLVSNVNVGIGTSSINYSLSVFTTDAVRLPVGTTAQRPNATAGLIRFNSSGSIFEGYNGSAWSGLGGATGGGTDQTFWTNGNTITADYTIPVGYNSGTFGPVTVAGGVNVTVSTGSTWSIV